MRMPVTSEVRTCLAEHRLGRAPGHCGHRVTGRPQGEVPTRPTHHSQVTEIIATRLEAADLHRLLAPRLLAGGSNHSSDPPPQLVSWVRQLV
jgi:hypothetical protein